MKTFLGRLSLLTSTGLPCLCHTPDQIPHYPICIDTSLTLWGTYNSCSHSEKKLWRCQCDFIGIFQSILTGVHLPHFAESIVLLIHLNTFYSFSAWIYSLGSSSVRLILFIILLYHLYSQMCPAHLEPTLKHFWATQFAPKNNQIQLLQLPPSISVF